MASILLTDLSRIIDFGGSGWLIGRSSLSSFGEVSLEKFLTAMISPRRSGCDPGNSGLDLEPSIVKTRSISWAESEPEGIPLSQPNESVEFP